MRKLGFLMCIVAAMALCASGQTLITFSDMPSVNHPSRMPDNYPGASYLNWDNFYDVDPLLWSGRGPGFLMGPDVRVAFIGGPLCNEQPSACFGSIKVALAPNSTASFQPLQISLAAGWFPNKVVVNAYDHSGLLGSVTWNLTTRARTFTFPAEWTNVTQLMFYPSPLDVRELPRILPHAGSMVVYTFLLYMNP